MKTLKFIQNLLINNHKLFLTKLNLSIEEFKTYLNAFLLEIKYGELSYSKNICNNEIILDFEAFVILN